VSASLSLFLTPLVLRFALWRDVYDHPGEHKGHTDPVPYLGGLAIVGAFALTVGIAVIVRPPVSGRGELFVILGLAVLLAVVGLLDDLRGLSPLVRLVVEVGAGLAVWGIGAGVDLFGPGVSDAIVTVVWVVGITNAFNLLDNMDGLSSGVAAIAAGSIFVIAASNGQFLVAALSIGLAGCALGFLRHNFHPATIYMGDAGALFLGFVLAYLGLKLRFDGPVDATFLVPIVVMGVPIFDTTLVTVTRLSRGVSPFQAGRDHTSHRLVRIGIPVPAAVALIYTVGVCLGLVALVISRVDRVSAYLLVAAVGIMGLLVGVLLAVIPYADE
jgi:UDP-GlcNAc:undecaprenyl-phosphate GlcNAc-1-phosphate transferase